MNLMDDQNQSRLLDVDWLEDALATKRRLVVALWLGSLGWGLAALAWIAR